MVHEHVKLLDDLNELKRVKHKLGLDYRSNTSLGRRGQSATQRLDGSADDGMNTSTGDYSQNRSRLQSAKAGSRPPVTGGRVMNRPQTTIGGRRGVSAGVNKPPAGNKSDRLKSAHPNLPNNKLASDIAAVQSTLYH
jgi:hypothetical protein